MGNGKPQALLRSLNQEKIVFILTVVLFALFSLILPNFLAANNILSLIRSVAVLGILGLGMLIVVLGRGIDLSLVANMAISVAWSLQLISGGMSVASAMTIGLLFALGMSLITGLLIAYAEIPSLFATLAMATFVYGFGRAHLITGCACRKSDPDILAMQSTQDRSATNVSGPLNDARYRRILFQR